MIRRRKRPRSGIREDPRIRCEPHLQWVRGLECTIAGMIGSWGARHVCTGKPQAHHVRLGTDGATGIKPSDIWAVPMCVLAHAEVHAGEETFQKRYGVDLKAVAKRLADFSPHRMKWMSE